MPFVLALLLLGCGSSQSALTRPATGGADAVARRVLHGYGIEDIERIFPDSLIEHPGALDRALGLAVESFLAHRDHPQTLASLAASARSAAPCAHSSPVAAAGCYMNRPGSSIALAGSLPASTVERDSATGPYWMFAVRVPDLADAPFWVAVGDGPDGEMYAASIAPSQIAMWCHSPERGDGQEQTSRRSAGREAPPSAELGIQGDRAPRTEDRVPRIPRVPAICSSWSELQRALAAIDE